MRGGEDCFNGGSRALASRGARQAFGDDARRCTHATPDFALLRELLSKAHLNRAIIVDAKRYARPNSTRCQP